MAFTRYVKIFTNISNDPNDAANKTNAEVESFLAGSEFTLFVLRETSIRETPISRGGVTETLFLATVVIEAAQDE